MSDVRERTLYGRRRGKKLRDGQQSLLATLLPRLTVVVPPEPQKIDLAGLFGGTLPKCLEFGFKTVSAQFLLNGAHLLLQKVLALLLVKAEGRRRKGQALAGDGSLRAKLQLPFGLTGAQQRSIAEIESDVAQGAPMLRLLQGDVGSGKTAVALHAMLIAVEAGAQAVMASAARAVMCFIDV